MAGDTVGCVEFVRITRELTSITLRGRTVIFVLAIFTIFVVVALPPLGDAFSCSISTLKLFVTALFITAIASWYCGGFISFIRRNGAIWPTITPFTLTSDMVTNLVY